MSSSDWSRFGLVRWIALLALVGEVFAQQILAHDGLHERLERLEREIELRPADAALLVARAELHREHGNWKLAFADLERANQLQNGQTDLELVRGRLLLDLRWYESARKSLDRFLLQQPQRALAYHARARALEALGELQLAAADWTEAIRLSSSPIPEQYIARAKCIARRGADYVAEALRGLAEGTRILGVVTSLELCALELELEAKRFDAALARIEGLLTTSARQDRWLAQKGDVLVAAGRDEEARRAYEDSLRAISQLLPKRRQAPATLDRIQYLRTRLSELSSLTR